MKLISCYIENFGGLSQYRLDFQEGLTTVQAPNGFGKTTLAEFLRAMFYGFPRGGKNLTRNLRKKYLPWQGGKYGGTLVFEEAGKRYRVERTFGHTPKGDHFTLYDADTNQKSARFSEHLGEELFQLDADSYERSTYLPQIHDGSSLSTDSIRAKLGDLVEDTNDVNNFDKAIEALRSKRSALVPFRGSGGSVGEAQAEISRLQTELSGSDQRREELETLKTETAQLEARHDAQAQQLETLRRQITAASEAAARASDARQYRELTQERQQTAEQRSALLSRYPGGIPQEEDVDALLPVFDRAAGLQDTPPLSVSDQELEQFLETQSPRFAQGLPASEELDTCQSQCQQWLLTQRTREGTGLSAGETEQLEALEPFFAPGVPEPDFLETCQEQQQKLAQLEAQRRQSCLSEEETARFQSLSDFFAPGTPSDAELDHHHQALARIKILRQTAAAPDSSSSRLFLPLLLAGLAAAAGGIFLLLAQHSYALGGSLMGVGALLLIGAMYLHLKDTLSQTGPRADAAELTRLEQSVGAFLARYFPPDADPATSLDLLERNLRAYQSLMERSQQFRQQSDLLTQQIDALQETLTGEFAPYFPDGVPEDALLTLNLKRTQYQTLRDRQAELSRQAETLTASLSQLETSIAAFLTPYCGTVSPEDFSDTAAALARDCATYRQALQRRSEREGRHAARESSLAECTSAVDTFAAAHQITLTLGDRTALQALRDDAHTFTALTNRLETLDRKLETFREKHPQVLEELPQDALPEIGTLKEEEKALNRTLSELSQDLADRNQLIRLLQDRVEQIPRQQDALSAALERKSQDLRRCALLDQTMEFLQKARDQLSHHYLGGVQSGFTAYMKRLTDLESPLFVNTDLEVQVERCGEARELTYFSAGQSDIVMLCMRLALVDALFKESQPLVILDDPFVNLDDEHTEKALDLLRNLAQDHQILYLVCNTSRSLEP